MHHYLVPEQEQGPGKNLEYHVDTDSIEDAEDWFVDAKERLLDVNNWKKLMTTFTMELRLTDGHGRMMNRHAHKGDHIRIAVPGPGPRELNAHDWVVIEAIEYDDYPDDNRETFAIKMAAANDPEDLADLRYISNATTGTLVVERSGKRLSVTYHGRNDVTNNGIEHMASGNHDLYQASAWLGISDDQWSSLLKGMIE